ncbi:MAG: OmpA family protein [Bdellovibrionales bacterium]|jgi:flagellar motor protein MotB|nr:OmpA family protein [Bdellovibrionales bacterium]MBT3527199.1 OmpA family protein [Bdellovibrionales bacterium]MBT7668638.1 OmpA family protein [Bdellovibrionales bacterium]
MARDKILNKNGNHNLYFVVVTISFTCFLLVLVKFVMLNLQQRIELTMAQKGQRAPASAKEYSASQLLGDQLTEILTREGESKAKMSYDSSQNMIVATFIDVGAIRFASNSAELGPAMKNNIQAAILQMSKYLFSNEQIRNKVESLEISGHSDPRFNQQYIDPKTQNLAAQNYNMELSAKRAISVYHFIFNSEDFKLKHRHFMHQITSISGFGHTQPVDLTTALAKVDGDLAKARKPASVSKCGRYDCGSSRRVEFRVRFSSKLTKKDLKLVNELVAQQGINSIDPIVSLNGIVDSKKEEVLPVATSKKRAPASMVSKQKDQVQTLHPSSDQQFSPLK